MDRNRYLMGIIEGRISCFTSEEFSEAAAMASTLGLMLASKPSTPTRVPLIEKNPETVVVPSNKATLESSEEPSIEQREKETLAWLEKLREVDGGTQDDKLGEWIKLSNGDWGWSNGALLGQRRHLPENGRSEDDDRL